MEKLPVKETSGAGNSKASAIDDNNAPGLRLLLSRDWFQGLILLLAVILVYQPVCYAGFFWDDRIIVIANPIITGHLGFQAVWTVGAAQFYPLTLTTFWIEYALWGAQPLPFHLVNVLMHGANAILLWRVLRSLQVPGAWLGAALWAVHPVQVESVAWIAEMKNTQSGLFFLLSILFFVKWQKSRTLQDQGGDGWNYGVTMLFAAMAMASKSSTVILPAVFCLCTWWIEGRWKWDVLVKIAPVFLMSIVTTAVSMTAFKLEPTTDPLTMRSWPVRLIDSGEAIWFYLGKLLWPHPLSIVYPQWQIDYGKWTAWLPLVAVILFLLVLWLRREAWARPCFFAFAYFLVALFPLLGVVSQSFLRNSLVIDHYQYLPAMGPLALAGAALTQLPDVFAWGQRWLRPALLGVILLALGITSWQRAWDYEDEEMLWIDTMVKNPASWLAYNNLGFALYQKGRCDEAVVWFRKSLTLNPDDVQTHNNLGNGLLRDGQVDEAMAQFQLALALNPDNAQTRTNIGNILLHLGKLDEALAQFQKAVEINPNYAEAHNNLGNVFCYQGQLDKATTEYLTALKLVPTYADAYNNLGNVLFQQGRMDEAATQYLNALRFNPRLAKAHANLGTILLQKGQMDEAMARFQKAVELDPNYGAAHYSLGTIFARKGQMEEAITQFRKALEIDPGNAEAHNNLGVALYKQGRLDEAIVQFREAVRIKPDYASAQGHLMKALSETRPKTDQGSKALPTAQKKN